ncbi:MAG: aromatic amino acid ammonia-lyase [Bacteroidales bacterium]|jgi:histidine ammonia-lyase|nr:aromatic amino acid ammonia-lyase [Bacteroidales bacterium]
MLQIKDFKRILFDNQPITLSPEDKFRVNSCFDFLRQFASDKIIYGINTGFGPMAQYRIDDSALRQLQYNIIRSHSTGAGNPLPDFYVKAAMIARLQTFLRGKSGVHVQVIDILQQFINHNIYPIVPEHGSVGASGDLVQLSHIALALIGEGEVSYRGERRSTAGVLKECSIPPLQMHLREGLAITNGTAVMTGIGLINLIYARTLLKWATAASVLINEIASSYDDFMSETLNGLKDHKGQQTIAAWMRRIAEGSKCLMQREKMLYHEHHERILTHKVQPYYSLRCVPQVLGPVLDELDNAEKVLVAELNSVDDNPVVDTETATVYHGGNFHGDYVSFEMDKLKIAVTKLTMLVERQMNYIFHDKVNDILPPFVNLGVLGLNYGLQASQFTATSTTAESQTLSNPMYVHSIPNNNDNQDIVSMGTNAALLCKHVVENGFQVMAIHLMALVQAVDCLHIRDSLSETTGKIYDEIRAIVPVFVEDTPKYREIASVEKYIKTGKLNFDLN